MHGLGCSICAWKLCSLPRASALKTVNRMYDPDGMCSSAAAHLCRVGEDVLYGGRIWAGHDQRHALMAHHKT
jgi:hypothetical protein